METDRRTLVERLVLELLAERGAGKSACPSEIARRLDAGHWRSRMDEVREVAIAMAAAGRIVVSQRGRAIDPARSVRGPVRLRLPGRLP